jgi:hypothetical protein
MESSEIQFLSTWIDRAGSGIVRLISLLRRSRLRSLDSAFLGKCPWTWDFNPLTLRICPSGSGETQSLESADGPRCVLKLRVGSARLEVGAVARPEEGLDVGDGGPVGQPCRSHAVVPCHYVS